MSNPQKPLVMVIDPDLYTWASLLPALDAEGIDATSCTAICAALSAIYRRVPDLVLVSKVREDCEGMILIGRIKEVFPDTKVILLVEPGDWPSRLDATDAGADDLVVKPSGRDDLMERIHQLLNRGRGQAAWKSLVYRS